LLLFRECVQKEQNIDTSGAVKWKGFTKMLLLGKQKSLSQNTSDCVNDIRFLQRFRDHLQTFGLRSNALVLRSSLNSSGFLLITFADAPPGEYN
jgi:hypothetical protein